MDAAIRTATPSLPHLGRGRSGRDHKEVGQIKHKKEGKKQPMRKDRVPCSSLYMHLRPDTERPVRRVNAAEPPPYTLQDHNW
jgi:hypothetical protein